MNTFSKTTSKSQQKWLGGAFQHWKRNRKHALCHDVPESRLWLVFIIARTQWRVTTKWSILILGPSTILCGDQELIAAPWKGVN